MKNIKSHSFLILFTLLLLLPSVSYSQYIFPDFMMTSNGNGVINDVVGFDYTKAPTGYGAYSADWSRDILFRNVLSGGTVLDLPNGMQKAGGWYFIVSDAGQPVNYQSAINRWTFDGSLNSILSGSIYEIRFTAGGGKAFMRYTTLSLVDVPFELWRIDIKPDGTDNSVRMIPWLVDIDFNDIFSFNFDHNASGGNNDPFSDWIFFVMPEDDSPGQSGYDQFVVDAQNGNYNMDERIQLARVCLMNMDRHQNESYPGAGDGPIGAMPETGTIFRLIFEPAINAVVDIKPGNDENSINFGNDKAIIPVAILTTPDFDATEVDPLSVHFGPNLTGLINSAGKIEDVNGDGYNDIVLHFLLGDTGIPDTCVLVRLDGRTINGMYFFGSDSIHWVIPQCDAIDDPGVHDRNKVKLLVSEDGQIAFKGDLYGKGFFPGNTCNQYIYAAGPSIGGIVNGIRIVAHAVYNSEYVPSEIGNTGIPYRVFNSSLPADKKNWPPDFCTTDGKPFIVSNAQNLVVKYNDLYGPQIGDQLQPLGIEVRQRSLAFNGNGLQNAIIFIWEITNISNHNISDAYFGYWCDADIGTLNRAQDDHSSCVSNMAITWDNDFSEANFKGQPGMVGFSFLETPDNAGVANYTTFTNPGGNGEVNNDLTQYNYLSGDFHYESNEITDTRMLLSTSLSNLNIEESKVVAGAFIFAPVPDGTTYLATNPDFPYRPNPSDPVLANILNMRIIVQQFYDQNLRGLALPKSSNNLENKVVKEIPNNFILNQNYPNPFNPSTTIRYGLPFESRVTVKIINILGQEVTTLVNSTQSAGFHEVNFNARNLASGIYFYRISAESLDGKTNFVDTKKLMLMK